MIKASELRIGNKVIVRTYEYTGGRPTGAIITKGIEVFAIIKHPISTLDKRPVIMFKDDDRMNEHFLNENVIPITLTPEWLERCGFKWEKGYMKLSLKNARLSLGFYAGVSDKMSLFQISIPSEGSVETEIGFGSNHPEYLHQLQNLYFALTGEELTIKE